MGAINFVKLKTNNSLQARNFFRQELYLVLYNLKKYIFWSSSFCHTSCIVIVSQPFGTVRIGQRQVYGSRWEYPSLEVWRSIRNKGYCVYCDNRNGFSQCSHFFQLEVTSLTRPIKYKDVGYSPNIVYIQLLQVAKRNRLQFLLWL